ncbi:MAG: FtsX-like permease family protein [Bacteroidota bacterium]
MKFAFYIARRYLFAKKSHNIINIISGISVAGITMGTMALIIVLSVFNGFENLVVTLFNSFNPDIRITANEGKTFDAAVFPSDQLKSIPGVAYYTEVIEENALLKYKDKQFVIAIKGVSSDFDKTSNIRQMMTEGDYVLQTGSNDFALVGQGVAYSLGLALRDYENPLTVYVPRRNARASFDPAEAFNSLTIQPAGVFSIQQDFDIKYVIVPLRFCRQLLDYKTRISAVEIGIGKGEDQEKVQREIQKIAGDNFSVKNRFQQEELLYKIMKSEKLAVFIILSFILFIATFNVIGSLSMLILDKKKDIAVLTSLGADEKLIRRIFLIEGLLIDLLGGVLGLVLGGIICWLQQTFSFITIQTSNSFVVDAYPVKMEVMDFLLVFGIVFIIGFAASWYPVKYISRKYLGGKLA